MICYMIIHEDKALWAAPAGSRAADRRRIRVGLSGSLAGLGLIWGAPAPRKSQGSNKHA